MLRLILPAFGCASKAQEPTRFARDVSDIRFVLRREMTKFEGCVFGGEFKNGFVISNHMDSSLQKNERSEKGSFTMTTACPHVEDKKKKHNKLRMNIRNVDIFRFETETSLE